MNIANVYPHPDAVGGAERSMHVGAQALRAAGHRLYLLHGDAQPPSAADDYEGAVSLPLLFDRRSIMDPAGLREAEAEAQAFLRAHEIDVLHVHGWPRSSTLERLAQRHRVVATAHIAPCPNNARYHWSERRACDRPIGLGCLTVGYASKGCGHLGNGQPVGVPGFVRGMADDRFLRRAIGRCARVVAPSQWIKNRLSSDGIPEDIIRVVQPPISQDGWTLPTNGAADGPPVLTFVGRLVDFKGPDHLLRASARIAQPHRVWLIGDGPMRAELERLAVELGIGDRVTFFGALPPEQIKQYRLQSAAIVVPSLWPDNFPAVGPEAMLLHRPVVAYRVGGIPEWCKDGETGRLVPAGDVAALADALGGLLSDPALARQMGEAGAALAGEWVPDAHARRLVEVYREALPAAPRSDSRVVAGRAA